jgi:hypothetical protein
MPFLNAQPPSVTPGGFFLVSGYARNASVTTYPVTTQPSHSNRSQAKNALVTPVTPKITKLISELPTDHPLCTFIRTAAATARFFPFMFRGF